MPLVNILYEYGKCYLDFGYKWTPKPSRVHLLCFILFLNVVIGHSSCLWLWLTCGGYFFSFLLTAPEKISVARIALQPILNTIFFGRRDTSFQSLEPKFSIIKTKDFGHRNWIMAKVGSDGLSNRLTSFRESVQSALSASGNLGDYNDMFFTPLNEPSEHASSWNKAQFLWLIFVFNENQTFFTVYSVPVKLLGPINSVQLTRSHLHSKQASRANLRFKPAQIGEIRHQRRLGPEGEAWMDSETSFEKRKTGHSGSRIGDWALLNEGNSDCERIVRTLTGYCSLLAFRWEHHATGFAAKHPVPSWRGAAHP